MGNKLAAWFARLEKAGIRAGMVDGCWERWGYGLILPDGGEVWLSDGGVPDGDISLDKTEITLNHGSKVWDRILEASRGFEGAFLNEDGNLFVLPDEVEDDFVPVEAP